MHEELFYHLGKFGLTQYEAKAYVALLKAGSSNAYQVSKVSEIPRARIYDVLASLVNQGLVLLEELGDGTKTYVALPSNVFMRQARDRWSESFKFLDKELRDLEQDENEREVSALTIRGEKNILALCQTLIMQAKTHVILSLWESMYNELLPDLQACVGRGCRVRGMTFGVEEPLNTLDKHRMNEYIAGLGEDRWFVLVVDSRHTIYGHSPETKGLAFYTDDPVHVFLFEDYIYHDVIVNRLVKKDQNRLDAIILPEMEEFFGRKMLPESFWTRIGENKG